MRWVPSLLPRRPGAFGNHPGLLPRGLNGTIHPEVMGVTSCPSSRGDSTSCRELAIITLQITQLEGAPPGLPSDCYDTWRYWDMDMPDDTLSRALRAYETLRRQLAPLSVQIEALQSNAGIHRLIEDADRTRTLMRAALGPVEDLRRSLQLNTELRGAATELRGFRRLGVQLERQFLLPELPDTLKLLKALEMGGTTARALSRNRDHVSRFRQAIEAMTTPWLDSQNQLRSLNGLLGLQHIGHELHSKPELPDTLKLLKALEMGGTTARALSRNRDHVSRFRQAIEAMTTPWLDSQNQLRSLNGLLGLQHIGHELHSKPVFDVESAERLRHYLGDWRARIDWPSAIFTDAPVRSGFYLERGLDPDLTYYPAIAFDQAIANAGVKRAPPPYIRAYAHADDKRGEEDAGFERNNAAQDSHERALRRGPAATRPAAEAAAAADHARAVAQLRR